MTVGSVRCRAPAGGAGADDIAELDVTTARPTCRSPAAACRPPRRKGHAWEWYRCDMSRQYRRRESAVLTAALQLHRGVRR